MNEATEERTAEPQLEVLVVRRISDLEYQIDIREKRTKIVLTGVKIDWDTKLCAWWIEAQNHDIGQGEVLVSTPTFFLEGPPMNKQIAESMTEFAGCMKNVASHLFLFKDIEDEGAPSKQSRKTKKTK